MRQKLLNGRNAPAVILIESRYRFPDPGIRDRVAVVFFDTEIGSQYFQNRHIDDGFTIAKATSLEVAEFFRWQLIDQLQQQPRFADTGFTRNPHHLAGSGKDPVKRIFEGCHGIFAADERRQPPGCQCLEPGFLPADTDQFIGFLGLLLAFDLHFT